MRKIINILLLCALGTVVLLTFLYLRSSPNPNEHFKGFNRIFIPLNNPKLDSVGMPLPQFRLAGADCHYLYAANAADPMDWLRISKNNPMDTTRLKLSLPHVKFKSIQYDANELGLFVADGTQPFVMCALPGQHTFRQQIQKEYFIAFLPLSADTRVLLSRVGKQLCLLKQGPGGNNVQLFPKLLHRQQDGFFSMYGQLHHDVKNHQVVYVYLNSNHFLVTDTTMKVIYTAHTVDTISQVKIKVGNTDKNTVSLASPPMPVNLHSCVAGGRLYVNSHIMATNEKPEKFRRNAVIDVYDLAQKGKYLYSFYLPNLGELKLNDFRVIDSSVFGQYLHTLIRWKIF